MSDKIGCTMQLSYGGNNIEAEAIISLLQDEKQSTIKKYTINYGESLKYTEDFENDTLRKITINTKDEIDASIKGGGIYFIFSSNGDKLLYIGKAKDLKNRLKQHLIACTLSTYSHIEDVCNYLKERKIRNEQLKLQYCIINSMDDNHNAAIEGALLDFIQANKEKNTFVCDCWNTRHD
ncbi:MAG: GIY-YIG nuclease family protein [Clostridia bacterium]|nr:GIY-YIG nuclease family protein [Clostridia bacterium]